MPLAASNPPSGRLHLRSLEFSDIPNILARVRDPKCGEYIPHLRITGITHGSLRERVSSWREAAFVSDPFLIIELIAENQVIGKHGFEVLDRSLWSGEAAVMLGSDLTVRGMGYAVEALETMLQYGFSCLVSNKSFFGC
ncbi:hypothetical protein PHISCL_02524 [Aspergillus sclerotialis]|uniref:N-acetyltransferase domain-containing protein n=1 Tax=Aspergillus sclerotialis TaxID=2070753 RepID=A0A3A2ZPK4_9EURO|nr:hypothetical protein PHISCL_02524 [Aspergillus sclerotialis]